MAKKAKMVTKSELAIYLSKLKVFTEADFRQEQYPTDSEVASDILWTAYMRGDIEGRVIADLGCGTGVLGIGALLLGAKMVYFVDKDADAINLLKENLSEIDDRNYEVINENIENFEKQADVVLQNPPFGTREKHADRNFLLKAFETGSIVYSFHKTSTSRFVEKISFDYGFRIVDRFDYEFPLKKTMKHHKLRIKRIEVTAFLLAKA